MKLLFFMCACLFNQVIFADCSFKITNSTFPSLSERAARASIYNLIIPLCTENPNKDPQTVKNCLSQPDNTLFMQPHYAATCLAVNYFPIILYLKNPAQRCYTDAVIANKNIVFNYPEDFRCVDL